MSDAGSGAGGSLLIVESPAKARTIKKYLGPGFVVKASVGHIKDLPATKLGVDVGDGFRPQYLVIEGKRKVIEDLKRAARRATSIYLAPDPDREGEAIAWHIAEELDLDPSRVHRVLFTEITRKGVERGLSKPGPLDQRKYESQQARRILDRLVGYELSPILWKKVRRGLSAGRVQSVAVRLIVEREEAINAFVSQEYWVVRCTLWSGEAPPAVARLETIDGHKAEIHNADEASAIASELERQSFSVSKVERKTRRRAPPPPLITSRLQQEASRRYKFSARRTMTAAQQLYEGVDLGPEGAVGLITYMRTDSTRLADDAIAMVREYIARTFGAQALPAKPNVFKARKGAQDAHEAIRPTAMVPPESIRKYLTPDQLKVYRLVWERFLACQMNPALYDVTAVDISAGRFLLRARGSVLKDPGWLDAIGAEGVGDVGASNGQEGQNGHGEDGDEATDRLPALSEGMLLELHGNRVSPEQKFTQPPSRFTEGTLVRELEERGIGRPSTYASILSTVQQRKYVTRQDGKLCPTELGIGVTGRLVQHFSDVMDPEFTARMEEALDKVEEGEEDWVELLRRFYFPFHTSVERAMVEMESVKLQTEAARPTDERCEECGRPMVVRKGRFSEFLSCSGFPKCRGSRPLPLGVSCPRPGCGGNIVERRSRKGRRFYGCSKYRENGCDFVLWDKPIPQPCPQCGALFLVAGSRRTGGKLKCVSEGCGYVADDGS